MIRSESRSSSCFCDLTLLIVLTFHVLQILIAELLFPSACVQRYSKKLSDKQVTELLRATCQKPHERMGEIQKVK
jgi:hypothetical protein